MGHVQQANRSPQNGGRLFSRSAEAVAWVTGIVLLVTSGARYVEGVTSSRTAIVHFAELQAAAQHTGTSDFTLWSPHRVRAWKSTVNLPSPAPLAVLRIPRIQLEVPVLEGTDEVTLNRAVGHIEKTAAPGTLGNSGIAGHRDGFFRGLKDLRAGDAIELDTLEGTEVYLIERTWIVDPDDISVLDPTSDPVLTLVTCYPFYFVGPAPKRYIVRAVSPTNPRL